MSDRAGAEFDAAVAAVIAAARKVERGCDCEYDHRCGRCERVISLRRAVEQYDAIVAAQAAGATAEQLEPIFELQKKAMWRLDFISSENSRGFHADQEAARVLGESIDYSRQAQVRAVQWRVPAAAAVPPRE